MPTKVHNPKEIANRYKQGEHAQKLADEYGITARQVQRIVKKHGVSRTISESYTLAIKQGRMKYYKKPEHLKKRRKSLPTKLRYAVLQRDNYRCVVCGATAKDGVRIEVDHIDDDATNNEEYNLQTLCNLCNQGKSYQ